MTRRTAAALLTVPLAARTKMEAALRERGDIPFAVGMAADRERVLFAGAEGVAADGVFAIASMTKAVTSAAALRLADAGRIGLDDPVVRWLPALGGLRVLTGFAQNGAPLTRPARTAITLRHLLTHTSGLSYSTWDEKMQRAQARRPGTLLAFEPGTRWQYGTGIDWAGRLVEQMTGTSLEEHFQRTFFAPLGMTDTSFLVTPERFPRLVPRFRRQASGELAADPHKMPDPPKSFNGGGGLYSTAADYIRFLRMILRGGEGLLSARVLGWMTENAIGGVHAGVLRTTNPAVSRDADFSGGPGGRHTLAFLLHNDTGRLCWAGLSNTYFWLDPRRGRCGVVLMQLLPFCDPAALRVLRNFEQAVSEEV